MEAFAQYEDEEVKESLTAQKIDGVAKSLGKPKDPDTSRPKGEGYR